MAQATRGVLLSKALGSVTCGDGSKSAAEIRKIGNELVEAFADLGKAFGSFAPAVDRCETVIDRLLAATGRQRGANGKLPSDVSKIRKAQIAKIKGLTDENYRTIATRNRRAKSTGRRTAATVVRGSTAPEPVVDATVSLNSRALQILGEYRALIGQVDGSGAETRGSECMLLASEFEAIAQAFIADAIEAEMAATAASKSKSSKSKSSKARKSA